MLGLYVWNAFLLWAGAALAAHAPARGGPRLRTRWSMEGLKMPTAPPVPPVSTFLERVLGLAGQNVPRTTCRGPGQARSNRDLPKSAKFSVTSSSRAPKLAVHLWMDSMRCTDWHTVYYSCELLPCWLAREPADARRAPFCTVLAWS